MEESHILPETEVEFGLGNAVGHADWWSDRRLMMYGLYVGILSLACNGPLISLGRYALKKDLHSYILLIPLVSFYLASLKHATLLRKQRGSATWARHTCKIFFKNKGLARAA